jgi:hypothetical protein
MPVATSLAVYRRGEDDIAGTFGNITRKFGLLMPVATIAWLCIGEEKTTQLELSAISRVSLVF